MAGDRIAKREAARIDLALVGPPVPGEMEAHRAERRLPSINPAGPTSSAMARETEGEFSNTVLLRYAAAGPGRRRRDVLLRDDGARLRMRT